MRRTNELFVERIVADLRAFSSDLLETGLATSGRIEAGAPRAQGMRAELGGAHALASLVPGLLADLATRDDPTRIEEHEVTTPLRASLSRRPCDWVRVGPRILPKRWSRLVPVPEPDLPALRWLIRQLRDRGEKLEIVRERVAKQVADARIARAGASRFAKSDELALDLLRARLDEAALVLVRAEDLVRRHAGRNLQPSASPPSPYPGTPAWSSLRRQATFWSSPSSFLPGYVRSLLHDAVAAADVPYLYQRWCGLKLLQAFDARGWTTRGDATGALFLAGKIVLERGAATMDLWVEPRLTRYRDNPTGFHCIRGDDVTPDFMLVTPGPYGRDAFVLDATRAIDRKALETKDRYLAMIAANTPGFTAGVPVIRHPVRAWACAPLLAQHCTLFRADGKTGCIPMHPVDWSPKPLEGWIGDVVKYANAWARR
ncbi:MAG: hypothetical protein HZA52_10185 [Planctomycetes bacterium]|nr:hypothetical protein [Planctomycetota bacterium]